jgi:hypothetical protein
MTRAELQAVVEVVLGIHATPDKVDTILRTADAYARAQCAAAPGADTAAKGTP